MFPSLPQQHLLQNEEHVSTLTGMGLGVSIDMSYTRLKTGLQFLHWAKRAQELHLCNALTSAVKDFDDSADRTVSKHFIRGDRKRHKR
jgi:hypothetical protein